MTISLVSRPRAPISLVGRPPSATQEQRPAPLATVERGPQGSQGEKGDTGEPGPPGPPAGSSYLTAGTALSGHRALMFDGSGNAIYADPTSPAYVFAGISLGAAQAAAFVEVSTEGMIVEPSWSWTLGPVFVAPGGLLTQAVPTSGVLHQVATAVSATAVFLYPAPPITLA